MEPKKPAFDAKQFFLDNGFICDKLDANGYFEAWINGNLLIGIRPSDNKLYIRGEWFPATSKEARRTTFNNRRRSIRILLQQ